RNAFVVDRPARGRLEVTRAGGVLRIENGLGADIEALVLRSEDGHYHALAGGLAQGASSELSPDASAGSVASTWGAHAAVASHPDLFSGTYLARLRVSPFTDAC